LALRLGLARGTPAAAHAERRDLLAAAFEAALAADEVARDLRRAEGAEAAARARVATGLAVVAPGHGTGDPVLAARALRAELEERGRRIASRGQAARLVARMAEECRLREAAQAASEAALAASLAGLWCEGRGADEMLRLIEGLGELGDAQRQAEERAHRVAQLRAALAAFDSRAAELRRVLDTGPGEGAAATLRQARARKDAAGEIARAIGSAVEARDRAAATLRDQAQIVRLREGAIADLLRGQAVEAGDPVEAIYLLADRDALRARRAEKGGEREAAGQGIDREALTEEEAETDPVRTAALEEAVRLAGEDRDAAFHRRGEAQSALDAAQRAAGGAELAQERAALLEGVREEARRAAVARIGLMAASGALRRLREDRRGPMLTATERAFSRMTGGEWQRLETQPTGTGERLVGIRSGVAVGAEAMSTGTRGQLYLALRVAGHADFAQRFGPLPFVTDDILETFDDARAAAALTLTAEMGRLGQAIMFTHHRHLVALGREVVPGVNVIDMAKDAPA
jgi:chromosome segregation protein